MLGWHPIWWNGKVIQMVETNQPDSCLAHHHHGTRGFLFTDKYVRMISLHLLKTNIQISESSEDVLILCQFRIPKKILSESYQNQLQRNYWAIIHWEPSKTFGTTQQQSFSHGMWIPCFLWWHPESEKLISGGLMWPPMGRSNARQFWMICGSSKNNQGTTLIWKHIAGP